MSAPPPYSTTEGQPQEYPLQQDYPPQQAPYPPQQQCYPPDPQQQPYPEKVSHPSQPQPPLVQQQAITTTVVTTQPTVVTHPQFGRFPVMITLPDGRQALTRVEYKVGPMTWLVCFAMFFVICLFAGIFGFLGLVAFCIDDTKDVYHYDPDGNVVGVYRRL